MSDVQFHETRMGRTYYEVTLPKLVEQLTRLNEQLAVIAERLASIAPPAPQQPTEHTDRS